MSTDHRIAVMKMVHLSSGFTSTSQTSRADRSKNRHLYSGNKTKPRKVRGRHQISSTVLMQWTFFVCDFAIQNLYVNLPYKICMWIPRTKLYVDLPYKISMWICHTNSCGVMKSCELSRWHCKATVHILQILPRASFLRRLLVQWSVHVIAHVRAQVRIPPTAFIMISWIFTDF